jgi:hypothetical protein
MIVIWQEAISLNLNIIPGEILPHQFHAIHIVSVFQKQVLPVRTAVVDVIIGVFFVFHMYGLSGLEVDVLEPSEGHEQATEAFGRLQIAHVPQSRAYRKSTFTVRYDTLAISGGRRLNWLF